MKLFSVAKDVLSVTWFRVAIGANAIIFVCVTAYLSLWVRSIGVAIIYAAICTIASMIGVIFEEFLNARGIQRYKTFFQMKWAFRVGTDNGCYWAALAMERFIRSGASEAERATIAVMMRNRVAKKMNKTNPSAVNRVRVMLEALAAAAPAWEADFLIRVARSKADAMTRGAAIRRVVSLRGVESLDPLMTLSDDAQVVAYVAHAIASIGPAAATPGVIARLKRMLGEPQGQSGWGPSAAARSLIAIGQATDPDLVTHIDKFDAWTRFVVRVKYAGLDATALADLLFEAGVVGEDRRPMIKPSTLRRLEKMISSGDGFDAIIGFLKSLTRNHVTACLLRATRLSSRNPIASITQA